MKLIKDTEHILLLSGTPAVMCPSELFCQLKVVNATLFESAKEFEKRYCDAKLTQHNYEGDVHYDTTGYSNLDELKLILDKLMIRRDKLDLSHYFPAKNRSIIRISTHISDEKLKSKFDYAKGKYFGYRRKARKFQNLTKHQKKRIFGKIEKHLNSFLGSTCDAKIFPVCSYIQQIAQHLQHKLIIVCRHTNMLDAIEKMCLNNNFDYIKMHCKTQSGSREELINRFKQNEETKIAILSYGTLASLTLNGNFIFFLIL
jgi:SWI/SNF-related matrix-associated actin-dependent regulator 1 of chromatin subfamily A